MEEGVVDDEPVWSGRVEWGKVSVPWHTAMEVGVWESLCMKGCSIDGGVFCSSSLQCHAVSQI